MTGIVATAEITIEASATTIWAALTDPAHITQYMFGSKVETDWRPGSPITWSGVYNGQRYQDKGEVITVEPPRRLVVTHFWIQTLPPTPGGTGRRCWLISSGTSWITEPPVEKGT
jgi:uncharacterized protein YndB with AHSA1/START domain